jgi:hypothetical protein
MPAMSATPGPACCSESIRNDIVASGLSLPYPQRDHVYHHDADGGRWPKS